MSFSLDQLHDAARLVREHVPPTPLHAWPLLARRLGAAVWVKHENHTPLGAFKLRGGLTYVADLLARGPRPPGLASATRGNHGQSLAYAGSVFGLPVRIHVPHGNSPEKNAAMRALGAVLSESGHDYNAARDACEAEAAATGLHMVQPFAPGLVLGVATYALEMFQSRPDLDVVYVPIGCGSGICGVIRVRDLLGLRTEVVGVVARGANAYARSVAAGRAVSTESADTIADGMAVRQPVPEALAEIIRGAARIVQVDDTEIATATLALWTDTHNLAEGAGAAPLAAALQEGRRIEGRRVGVVLSGGNLDVDTFQRMVGMTGG